MPVEGTAAVGVHSCGLLLNLELFDPSQLQPFEGFYMHIYKRKDF